MFKIGRNKLEVVVNMYKYTNKYLNQRSLNRSGQGVIPRWLKIQPPFLLELIPYSTVDWIGLDWIGYLATQPIITYFKHIYTYSQLFSCIFVPIFNQIFFIFTQIHLYLPRFNPIFTPICTYFHDDSKCLRYLDPNYLVQ